MGIVVPGTSWRELFRGKTTQERKRGRTEKRDISKEL
jgi:hypothetical protein